MKVIWIKYPEEPIQRKLVEKKSKPRKARENADDQVVIGAG